MPARIGGRWTLLAGVFIIIEAVIIMWMIGRPAPAAAHTPDVPCARVERITGTTIEACRAARIRHAANHAAAVLAHRCRTATRMPADLCRALGTAIVLDRRPRAWATDRSLEELLRRESTHDPDAVNDRSDACGWFQRLVRHPHPAGGRGCPWAFVVLGRRDGRRIERVLVSDVAQARNGLRYIAGRYGSPAAALRHHDLIGWY